MIPFIKPEMPPVWSYLPDLIKVHLSGQYSNGGQMIRRLESQLAKVVVANEVVCVSNATVGLEVAIKATIGRGNGTKQIAVPAYTFPATVNAIVNCGYKPYYLDIHYGPNVSEEINLLADFSKVRNERPKDVVAFMPVASFGKRIPLSYLKSAREVFGKIIVDAAPGIIANSFLNMFSDAVVYSLHATKSVPCGEGGFISFNDRDYARNARLLINFGLENGSPKISAESGGTNGKMSEISACIALASLRRLPSIVEKKLNLLSRVKTLDYSDGWRLQYTSELAHLMLARVENSHKTLTKMKEMGVECKIYYRPLTTMGVPNSWKAFNELICLPWYSKLTNKEIEQIKEVLTKSQA